VSTQLFYQNLCAFFECNQKIHSHPLDGSVLREFAENAVTGENPASFRLRFTTIKASNNALHSKENTVTLPFLREKVQYYNTLT